MNPPIAALVFLYALSFSIVCSAHDRESSPREELDPFAGEEACELIGESDPYDYSVYVRGVEIAKEHGIERASPYLNCAMSLAGPGMIGIVAGLLDSLGDRRALLFYETAAALGDRSSMAELGKRKLAVAATELEVASAVAMLALSLDDCNTGAAFELEKFSLRTKNVLSLVVSAGWLRYRLSKQGVSGHARSTWSSSLQRIESELPASAAARVADAEALFARTAGACKRNQHGVVVPQSSSVVTVASRRKSASGGS